MRLLVVVLAIAATVIPSACSSSTTTTRTKTARRCLDLRNPKNLATVRSMPMQELRRYAAECGLTFSKRCSGSGTTVDNRASVRCEVFDTKGAVVRTYTTTVP